jgi:nucleotide-binding universal stress UspA family protein
MEKTTIVCAVDFSRASLLGLRMAIRYAERARAHLRVVHVLRTDARQPETFPRHVTDRTWRTYRRPSRPGT